VGGRLDVGGTSQQLYDVVRFTDAGEIRLTAETGDVVLDEQSVIRVAAQPGGGNAGSLIVSSANGGFTSGGTLLGSGGAGGRNGSFTLDTATLPSLKTLAAALTEAGLTESQTLRVRTGNVLLDGVAQAGNFQLSTDAGSITVTGTIDASGTTGGTIRLVANGDVVLADSARLTVAGEDFSSAGKGGAIYLEAGAQTNGVIGSGLVDIQSGSTLDCPGVEDRGRRSHA
jgi:hypothetical protein